MIGFIYNSYLFACSTNGYINIWDIYEKKLIIAKVEIIPFPKNKEKK